MRSCRCQGVDGLFRFRHGKLSRFQSADMKRVERRYGCAGRCDSQRDVFWFSSSHRFASYRCDVKRRQKKFLQRLFIFVIPCFLPEKYARRSRKPPLHSVPRPPHPDPFSRLSSNTYTPVFPPTLMFTPNDPLLPIFYPLFFLLLPIFPAAGRSLRLVRHHWCIAWET